MQRTAKIAISIEPALLARVDKFVENNTVNNRSQAFQEAVLRYVERLEHQRLEVECKKLNPDVEQELADEGINEDAEEWPEY